MNARLAILVGGLGTSAAVLLSGRIATPLKAQTEDERDAVSAPAQEGVEVQARGPVHEAFAGPAIRGPRATPAVPKQPPEPVPEEPPNQRPEGDNVQWIPGYWGWDDDRQDFLWVSGIWRSVPPGRQWVSGCWNQVEGGWQWVPGYWAGDEQQQVELLPEPPDPIREAVPAAASEDQSYVPGTWVYRDTRYVWRPGFYVQYQPGWVWIPAHYVWTPVGYLFVDGYWDYSLDNRGLLFAPVYVNPRFYNQPGWVYRPSYCIPNSFLFGALFVRPTWAHYYFGDYFEAGYQRQGFVSWVDFRVGRSFYDPNLNYYRWRFRDDPRWLTDLRQVYVGRREGIIARPPHNLGQQTTVVQNNQFVTVNNIRNVNVNNVTNLTNITRVAPLATLNQVNRSVTTLRAVPPAQVRRERDSAKEFHTLARERAKLQAQVMARGSPLTTGAPTATAAVRVDLPGLRDLRRPAPAVQAPPLPNVPRPSERPGARAGDNLAPRPGERFTLPPIAPERLRPLERMPPSEVRPPSDVRPPTQRRAVPPTEVRPPSEMRPPTERRVAPPTEARPPQPSDRQMVPPESRARPGNIPSPPPPERRRTPLPPSPPPQTKPPTADLRAPGYPTTPSIAPAPAPRAAPPSAPRPAPAPPKQPAPPPKPPGKDRDKPPGS